VGRNCQNKNKNKRSPRLQKLCFGPRWSEFRNSHFQTNRSAPDEMAYVKLYWQNISMLISGNMDFSAVIFNQSIIYVG